jgi:hypothetical protein
MISKEGYTKIFLKEMTVAQKEENAKNPKLWWKNNRTKERESLRLTDEGLRIIKEVLDLQVYEVPFPPDLDLKPQVLLHLDRFLDCPYHLTENMITVISERKAIELHLFAGDVRKYGLIKAMRREIPKEHKTF